MSKRTVRLTESELKNIITESVKNIISELDYKTLANAEKEASRRGQKSYWSDQGYDFPNAVSKAAHERIRAERFGKAARDAFNRDHGYKTGDYWDNEGYAEVGLGGDFRSTEEFAPHAVGYRSKGDGNPAKYERGMRQDSYERMEPEEFFETNPEAAEAYRNADTEWKNYRKGNYEYTQGKGWHLKDNK